MSTILRGYHLLAEGEGIDLRRGAIRRFLERAVDVTGLTVILGPVIDEEHGVGFVVIAESHISVHVKGERAWVDVFSCRPFDATKAVGLAGAVFGGEWTSERLRRDGP